MAERRLKLGAMPMGRLVANISLPLMISMLVQSMYNIVDSVYVARIGEKALTATALAFPAQLLIIAVSVGTGVGVNSLLSRRLGEQKHDEVSAGATSGLILSLLSSLLFTLLGLFATRRFISAFTTDPAIREMGVSYLRICLIFSQGVFLATMGERLLQATGNTFLSMLAQASGAVVNIALDPVFIFGLLGVPKMGVTGAAVATVIGQYTAAILALFLNARKNREIKFRFRGFRPDIRAIAGIYKVGLPTMVVQTTASAMLLGMNKLLAASTTAVALFGVYFKLQSFVFMPVSGLSQGLIPIVGYNFGARMKGRVVSAYRITILIAAAIMALGTIAFELFPEVLLSMFDAGDEMMRLGVPALRIIAVSFVPMSVTVVSGFACAGLGNGMVNMFGALLRQLVILLPAAYLLERFFGVSRVWYAFPFAELAAAVAAALFVLHEYRTRIRPLGSDEM
jgi:putative MATE family efflux protein